MPDFRSYYSTDKALEPEGLPELRLSPEESHHLVAVNRARRGDPVIAFNGAGREWECELVQESKNAAVLRVQSSRQAPPLACKITLAQALPKGPSMDAIIRKATEIGASCIVPLESERTQVHLEGGREDKKVEKWRTAALEAAKQCGNPWLPEIQPIQNAISFMKACAAPEAFDLRLIASLHPGAISLKTAISDFTATWRTGPKDGKQPHILWLIGPEGDFSPVEMEAAIAASIQPVTLGPLVLRCETAATYALSVVSYELQNM